MLDTDRGGANPEGFSCHISSQMTLVTTQLLNDDGSASMATAFMMSHHCFRRDIALFKRALAQDARLHEAPRIEALQEEWKGFHAKLHGHHQVEDNGIFPGIKAQHAELGSVIAELVADHQRLDPLLEAGERAFAKLPATAEAAAIVAEMAALLDKHLGLEEQKVVPLLRGASAFPAPASDAEAEMYAEGFAWACHGIASEVLEQVYKMLPASVTSRLPAARIVFARKFDALWGATVGGGASTTSVPDWLR
jgi:hemerythrin-like domain-containing protein